MASGVRLHHPELRNCIYTLIHEGRPLQAPANCWACGQVHFHKTYHLGLDEVGDVVVSEQVFARLKEAGLGELKVLREVSKPDPLILSMDPTAPRPIVVSRENGRQSITGGGTHR